MARGSLDNLQDLVRRSGTDLKSMSMEAERISASLVELDRFIRINITAFRKVVKKFDKVHGDRAAVWLAARVSRESFYQIQLEKLALVLSEIFRKLRAAAGDTVSAAKSGALKKMEFKRSTTKYWIRPEDQLEVLMELCRHVPLFLCV